MSAVIDAVTRRFAGGEPRVRTVIDTSTNGGSMPKRLEMTPAVIDKRVKRGTTIHETLTLHNRGSEAASYLLEDETGFVKNIAPDNVAIEAGKSERVTLTLEIPTDAAVWKSIEANILAVNPDDPDDTGIVDIKLRGEIPGSWIAIAIIAIVLIIALILLLGAG
jgi:hypothetical protein